MDNDLERLKKAYFLRKQQTKLLDRYSLLNPSNLFAVQMRQSSMFPILTKHGFFKLNRKNALEIGCGTGSILLELQTLGFPAKSVFGIDILSDRLSESKKILPLNPLLNADGQNLPFKSCRFDLVLQFTAFSSILDDKVKITMASEMLRVLKPDGLILWYDFWLNPINKQTKGIRRDEIHTLFPSCSFEFHKITLAPPIARMMVPVSLTFCAFLESLKVFNSHYLVGIKNKPNKA
jgi:ubiquinone/menaquinone biosynthesis C-methylase UbiE